jgi:hypothetical protein
MNFGGSIRAGSANSNLMHHIRINMRPAICIAFPFQFAFALLTFLRYRASNAKTFPVIFKKWCTNQLHTSLGYWNNSLKKKVWNHSDILNKEKNWSVDWRNVKMQMPCKMEFAFALHLHWCKLAKLLASHANSHCTTSPGFNPCWRDDFFLCSWLNS